MKIINSTIGILLLLVSASCNNGQNLINSFQTVDIVANINNMKQINLSQFTNDIRYVSFENREDVTFSNVYDFDISDNLILITDRNVCLLYDKSGHFILKFGEKGKGPGEYQSIENPSFSKDKKVYFNSIYDLFEFNLNGSFVNKYSKSLLASNAYYLQNWYMIDDSLVLGHIDNRTGHMEYKAMIINKHGDIKHAYKNYDLLESKGSRVFGGTAHIFQFNRTVFFNEQFNDTLFSLNDNYELIPRYFLNLGNLKVPASIRVKFPPIFSNYILINDIFQTKNYLLLTFNFGDRSPARRLTPGKENSPTPPDWYNTTNVLGLFNKHSGELIFCQPTSTDNTLFTTGIYNDIDAGPRFFPGKMVNDSTMVMIFTAKQLKDHVKSDDFKNSIPKYPEKKKQLEELANKLTEFDNPVLMFVTFKK